MARSKSSLGKKISVKAVATCRVGARTDRRPVCVTLAVDVVDMHAANRLDHREKGTRRNDFTRLQADQGSGT